MHFKTLLIILTLTFLTVCSAIASPSTNESSTKNWINSPPSDTEKYFYALGYAKTLKDAKSDALANISSKISISVASNFSNSVTAKRQNENEDILLTTKSEVVSQSKNIEYSDVKVQKSYNSSKEWIVLVRVDKSILTSTYMRKLKNIDNKLKLEWDIYQDSGYFEKLKLSSVINQYLRESDTYFPLLHALNSKFDDYIYTSRYMSYTKEMRRAKNELVFKINSDENSEPLASLIRTELSSQNATFNNKTYNVLITITTKAKKRKYRSSNEKFAKLTFALRKTLIKATDRDGNIVSNVVYKTKSGSSEGFEDAIARTAKYEKMIERKGIIAFIVGNQ